MGPGAAERIMAARRRALESFEREETDVDEIQVVDGHGRPLAVGDEVLTYGGRIEEEPPGVITLITEPEGDADAEGRSIMINPGVYVAWPEGPEEPERFGTHWLGRFYDDDAPFECDDLALVPLPVMTARLLHGIYVADRGGATLGETYREDGSVGVELRGLIFGELLAEFIIDPDGTVTGYYGEEG
jgi:hypothetical protein